jgi:hypothetical protein
MRILPLLLITLAACVAGDDDPVSTGPQVHATNLARLTQPKKSPNVIDHGGAVLPASKTVAIYWGNAADFPSDLQKGMASLLGGLNGSSYLKTANQYMRGAGATTSYGGSIADASAPPKSAPSSGGIAAEVCKLVANPDPNTLYIVFTSNAPKINYCAWHDRAICNGVEFEIAYVPNQADLPFCSPYTVSNLGCNAYSNGTVASADSVAHEFMETITDAHIDAWYDAAKAEIADKCEYNYASCVALGADSWQIQTEWSNAATGCVQTTP